MDASDNKCSSCGIKTKVSKVPPSSKCNTNKQSPIEDCMESLEKVITILNLKTQDLLKKLYPVLRPSDPQPVNESAVNGPNCSVLVSTLSSYILYLQNISSDIEDIMNRLEV